MKTLLEGPVQIAYHVRDVRAAARRAAEATGAGPFFIAERIPLAESVHRGSDCPFVHTSAYGQSGAVMLEFVQQDEEGPSPFRDLYAPEEEGIHHVAYFAADLDEAIAHLERLGHVLATRAVTVTGQTFAFVDATPTLGHMIELYEPTDGLTGFYELVRRAAEEWDGSDPLRAVG
jgi:catechol 2,3-dioxygenase-like lactoylglutathione lyase family enzyme